MAIEDVFAGAMSYVLLGEILAVWPAYIPFKHRGADSGPPPQISLALQEVLPHPFGFAGGGVPDTLGRRWQALQRRVQCKPEFVWCDRMQCRDVFPVIKRYVCELCARAFLLISRALGSVFIVAAVLLPPRVLRGGEQRAQQREKQIPQHFTMWVRLCSQQTVLM